MINMKDTGQWKWDQLLCYNNKQFNIQSDQMSFHNKIASFLQTSKNQFDGKFH